MPSPLLRKANKILCINYYGYEIQRKNALKCSSALLSIFANIALYAYAALVISIMCLIRNILSYKDKLTKNITIILIILGIIIGLYANNRGVIGWLPIIASATYTICIYVTTNEQQMRYALIFNMLLWFIHNAYVQAYPSAVANIVLCVWTAIQILRYIKTKKQTGE